MEEKKIQNYLVCPTCKRELKVPGSRICDKCGEFLHEDIYTGKLLGKKFSISIDNLMFYAYPSLEKLANLMGYEVDYMYLGSLLCTNAKYEEVRRLAFTLEKNGISISVCVVENDTRKPDKLFQKVIVEFLKLPSTSRKAEFRDPYLCNKISVESEGDLQKIITDLTKLYGEANVYPYVDMTKFTTKITDIQYSEEGVKYTQKALPPFMNDFKADAVVLTNDGVLVVDIYPDERVDRYDPEDVVSGGDMPFQQLYHAPVKALSIFLQTQLPVTMVTFVTREVYDLWELQPTSALIVKRNGREQGLLFQAVLGNDYIEYFKSIAVPYRENNGPVRIKRYRQKLDQLLERESIADNSIGFNVRSYTPKYEQASKPMTKKIKRTQDDFFEGEDGRISYRDEYGRIHKDYADADDMHNDPDYWAYNDW